MAKLINIGFGNVVNSQKIVAVVNPDAAPVKRMVQSVKGSNSLVDATQGRKTKSVIVTSDHILNLFPDLLNLCLQINRYIGNNQIT